MSQIGGEAEMAISKVAADKAKEEQRLREFREEDDDFDWTGGGGGGFARSGDDDETSQTSNDDTLSTGVASGHMRNPASLRISTANSVGSASTYTFCEDDFLLPALVLLLLLLPPYPSCLVWLYHATPASARRIPEALTPFQESPK